MRTQYSPQSKLVALMLCLCIAVTLLFSAWFIVSHADHDCSGHDCPICAQLHQCADILQKLNASLGALAAALLLAPAWLDSLAAGYFASAQDTPVQLKVRMNN